MFGYNGIIHSRPISACYVVNSNATTSWDDNPIIWHSCIIIFIIGLFEPVIQMDNANGVKHFSELWTQFFHWPHDRGQGFMLLRYIALEFANKNGLVGLQRWCFWFQQSRVNVSNEVCAWDIGFQSGLMGPSRTATAVKASWKIQHRGETPQEFIQCPPLQVPVRERFPINSENMLNDIVAI